MGFSKTYSSYIDRFVTLMILLIAAIGQMSAKNFVVTLDAGHGGHDYGALGEKTNEKTLTLSVVTDLGKLIEKNLADVDVVYTRDRDIFIPLNERASIANNAKSDLFISDRGLSGLYAGTAQNRRKPCCCQTRECRDGART